MTMAFAQEVQELVKTVAQHPDALLFAEVVGVWANTRWLEVTLALGKDRLTLSVSFYDPDRISYRTWEVDKEEEAIRGEIAMPQAYEVFLRMAPALVAMVVANAVERLD